MPLGDKIQNLRKSNNKTQDELAEVLGVSRQALSKWENGTSNPELDKIILLSNYFCVSTDYLLKEEYREPGGELKSDTSLNVQKNVKIPGILSTTVIAIGFIIAFALANDGSHFFYWQFKNAALGIIIQIIGIGLYEVMYFSKKYKDNGQYIFWIVNTWILSIMPAIFLAGICTRFISRSFDTIRLIGYVGLGYLLFNGIVSIILLVLSKKHRNQAECADPRMHMKTGHL